MKEQEASNMMQLTSTKFTLQATCIDANSALLVDCFRYGVHTGEKQAVNPSRNLDFPIEGNFKLVYKACLPLVLGWPCDLCAEDGLDAEGVGAGLGAAAGLDWLPSLIPS